MRNALAAILVCMLSAGAFALDVNKGELESIANQRIQFLNYEGPPQKVETRAQITGIGSFLGSDHVGTAGTRDYAGRYRIIHAVDPSTPKGLDADIFIIEKDAQVDHIDNIRLILAGYFQTAYAYNQSDSTLLAYFTTIYNAVYRGNMTFFEGRYKSVVTQNLSPENAGIATAYNEWPGRTRMVIPLGPGAAVGALG
ncbi:MAG TPA: P83/100 family protein, partial [Spirochaetia bacterium]|nr:P83/100 family protein [Spirochaetia bacterium]